MSTQPDPLATALLLAKEQLDSRITALTQASDTVANLGDALRSLAARLNDVSVAVASAIQAADKAKALLGTQSVTQ